MRRMPGRDGRWERRQNRRPGSCARSMCLQLEKEQRPATARLCHGEELATARFYFRLCMISNGNKETIPVSKILACILNVCLHSLVTIDSGAWQAAHRSLFRAAGAAVYT